jgi:tRNA(Ile)-lysidine synthase
MNRPDPHISKRRLTPFVRRLLAEWETRAWPRDGACVVAVSGGADSTALALALAELLTAGRIGLDVTAAHFNHGLRGKESDEDESWVAELCRSLGFTLLTGRADLSARVGRDNLEQAARRARYEFLAGAAESCGAWEILTAHTLDDQAETVLLRLLRGSGADGLAGMRAERLLFEDRGDLRLLRPLVSWARRSETEGFCRARGVGFRLDAMNEDEGFARVRVRRRLLPLLETFNPRAAEALARAAELLRDDADALEEAAARLLEEAAERVREAADESEMRNDSEAADEGARPVGVEARPLRVEVLLAAPTALRRRALRQWVARGRGDLRRVELAHVRAVERLLEGARGGRVAELPGGARVERRRGLLRFHEGPLAPGARHGESS